MAPHPSAGDLRSMRSSLARRRRELLTALTEHLHASAEAEVLRLSNHFAETGDWVTADVSNDIDIAILTQEIAELQRIDAALKRLQDGWRGECDVCGKIIPMERLRANPSAHYCIACQTRKEKQKAGKANSTS